MQYKMYFQNKDSESEQYYRNPRQRPINLETRSHSLTQTEKQFELRVQKSTFYLKA